MKKRKRYVWEKDGIMYLHDTLYNLVRILNSKTNDCRETDNPHMISKTIQNGEEVVALTED
jgi:hypothetical protein